MQAQLDALNKRLEQLQQMLQARLPPANTTGTHPSAEPPPAQPRLAAYQELGKLRANWEQLQRGLSQTELRQLLGNPRSELALDRQTLWYYLYPGIGGGSVMLDSKNKVTGWQEPPFRGW